MRLETQQEIARRGRVRNAASAEQMLDGVAVLEVGDVFDTAATDVQIVDVREDVVGLEVRCVELE